VEVFLVGAEVGAAVFQSTEKVPTATAEENADETKLAIVESLPTSADTVCCSPETIEGTLEVTKDSKVAGWLPVETALPISE
jgi:hypothetical protein